MRAKSIQNRNIKIGLDLDGVIIDHTVNKIKLAKQYGYFLKPAETSSEIMKKLVPEEVKIFIQKGIYGKEGLTSKPIKNAKETLKKITKSFSAPYIISRRHQGKKFALRWLKNNKFFPLLNRRQMFFVDSDIGKNPLCKKLDINVYLDDKVKVLKNLISVEYKVLFDPYCHHYKNPPALSAGFGPLSGPPKNIKVVKTWPEFYRYLSRLNP